MRADSFEQLCFIASRENWCWNLYCTTCGHLHFRYSFVELSRGKSPADKDWLILSKVTSYTKTLGDIPRTFTAHQKHILLENFKTADLSVIASRCRFPDWLGYLGLVINHLFGDFSDDQALSVDWASQLKKIVPISSRSFNRLNSILTAETGLLGLNDLELCESDLKFTRY